MKTKNKGILIIGLVALIAIGAIITVSALTDPYPMDGYVKDKAGNTLSGANVTFYNTNTTETIYDDSSASGWYSADAGNFPNGYQNGHIIEYTANYSGTTYLNESYSFVINTTLGSNTMNITLDQAPTMATGFTDLGMNLIDHTPAISWTKGTDADSGDTVTTYVYVGTGASPTTEEGNNTGTTIDLGSTVSLTDGNTYYYRLRSYDGERWSDYTTDDTFRINSVPTTSGVDIQGAQEIQHITDHTPDITWSYNDPETDTQTKYNATMWTGTGGTGTLMGNSGDVTSAGTTWTYSGTELVDGTTYYARVYTNDNYEWGTWSETQFRMNSEPTVNSVQISPGTTNTTTDLTGNGTYADTEGDSESGTTYKWFKNGAEIGGETTTSLVGTNFIKGDEIIFQYMPNDSYEAGTVVNSSTSTIGDTVPTLDSIGAKNVADKVQVNVDGNGTDQDATDGVDTFTFSCNRTDLFAFDTATGIATWTPFYNQTGIYYVDFGVSDGTTSDNETITITVSDVTYDTGLFDGWNLVAWIAETNGTAGEFADIVTSATYITEKNATTGNYVNFNPSAPTENNFTTMKGKGYYGQTTATIPFSRSRIDDVTYNTTLQNGWSIFGYTNASNMTANQVATDIGGNCQYLTIKNATTSNYENFNPSAPTENNFNLTLGIAYYAKVSSETVWSRDA